MDHQRDMYIFAAYILIWCYPAIHILEEFVTKITASVTLSLLLHILAFLLNVINPIILAIVNDRIHHHILNLFHSSTNSHYIISNVLQSSEKIRSNEVPKNGDIPSKS